MSLKLNSNKVNKIGYFHREYENDVEKRDPNDKSARTHVLRFAQVALPFVALYKPFGQPLAILMGGTRIISCISKTYSDCSERKNNRELAYKVLQITVAIAALAGTYFAHPMGMVITTCHDLGINVIHLHQAWIENDSSKALEMGLQVLNNSVYLGLMIIGSTEILVASLAIQILTGLHQTSAEFEKGNYLEMGAGILMVALRANQCAHSIKHLHTKWKEEPSIREAGFMRDIEECNSAKSEIFKETQTDIEKKTGKISPEALDVILKHSGNSKGISPLHNAIEKRDFLSAEILIKEGLFLEVTDSVETIEKHTRRHATPTLAILFLALDGNDPVLTTKCDNLLKLCFEKINPNFICDISTARIGRSGKWECIGGSQRVNQAHYLIQEINNRICNPWVLRAESNKNEYLGMIDILLKKGADINAIADLLKNYLVDCDLEGIKFYVERGYLIKEKDYLSNLAIYLHSFRNGLGSQKIMEIIRYLQLHGLNLNKPSPMNPHLTQLDSFLKQILAWEGCQDLKRDLVPFLLSLGAKA